MHGSKNVKENSSYIGLLKSTDDTKLKLLFQTVSRLKAPRILGFDIRSWCTVAPSCGHFEPLGQCLLSYFLNYIKILDAVVKRKIAALPSSSETKSSNLC